MGKKYSLQAIYRQAFPPNREVSAGDFVLVAVHDEEKRWDEMVAAKELATKHDLYVALAETRHEILKWITGLLVAQTAMLVAVTAFIK